VLDTYKRTSIQALNTPSPRRLNPPQLHNARSPPHAILKPLIMTPTSLTKLIFLLSALILTSLACKCVDDKRRWIKNAPMTEFCCRHMYGNAWLTKGPGLIDCEAWSIQNELANFSDCCGSGKKNYFSDCPCSHGCRSLPPPAGAVEVRWHIIF